MQFDWMILDGIQNIFKSDFLDMVMPNLTALGEYGIIWILFGIALLISKKYRKYGVLVLVGLLLGLIIGNGILKNTIMRDRPCWIHTDVKLLIPIPKDYSFPSGHTQSAVIAATLITLANKKFGFVVIPLALLLAFSRLYLYVHFPTDIIGGAIVGLLIAAFTYVVGGRLLKIKNAPCLGNVK